MTDILTQFEFLYWLRDRALARAGALTPEDFRDARTVSWRDLRSTLVHELDVERSWLLRLQGQPQDVWDVTLEAKDYPDVAAIADEWQHAEADALAWLSELSEPDLAAPNTENGLEGYPLSAYLEHVVMHGVESLSAAAILLDRAGQPMGDVGFLDFLDATAGRPTTP